MVRVWLFIVVLFFYSCRSDKPELLSNETKEKHPSLPTEYYDYTTSFPAHLQNGALQFFNSEPTSNPITNEGATLGRVLFYDTYLSIDNSVACASCHKQEFAFTDGKKFSNGVNGLTSRNSMALCNLNFGARFFWDLRALGLEQQVLMPIQDPIEMGMTLPELVAKLDTISYYPELFSAAFGDPEINTDRISMALAQFVRSIKSYRSKYDQGLDNNFANFSSSEMNGKALFYNGQTRCNQCHMTENFFSPGTFNNGLDSLYTDGGQGDLNGDPSRNGWFKTVTLRNIELTSPYMHDGRFQTLEEVVDHYTENLQAHPYIADQLTTTGQIGGPPLDINLTPQEKQDLIAFLKTLTDWDLINDPRFSNPFE